MGLFDNEIRKGERFRFGNNWRRFLAVVNEERIEIAEDSLKEMLRTDSLNGKSFIDVGSGSGLFSLAARRLGATVYSFDYDPQSVSCTLELRKRYFPNDDDHDWEVHQGSILDSNFLEMLPTFDVVYSWGVLHHTGDMWAALNNIVKLVKPHGYLFIAIYNDQGHMSKFWGRIKKTYCSSILGQYCVLSVFIPYFVLRSLIGSIIKRATIFSKYKKSRGMSIIHDWVDWLGGYPFEVARIDDIVNFYLQKGFSLFNVRTNCGLGNNQFVFEKSEFRPPDTT